MLDWIFCYLNSTQSKHAAEVDFTWHKIVVVLLSLENPLEHEADVHSELMWGHQQID